MQALRVVLVLALGVLSTGVLSTAGLYAQPHQGDLTVERFTVAEGLPDNQILTLLEDHYGFLWIGTRNGLVRYDGYDFTIYRPDPTDTTSLYSRFINVLLEDRERRVWVGTENGLDRFDRGRDAFTHYRHDPDDAATLSGNRISVRGLFEDKQGRLWVLSDGGLDRLDPETGTVRRFGPHPDLSHGLSARPSPSRAPVILQDQSGTLWVGTLGGGLNRLDARTDSFTAVHLTNDPRDVPADTIMAVYEAPSEPGVLWLGLFKRGLVRYDPATGATQHFRHEPADPTSLSSDFVLRIHEDRRGRLWVVTADQHLHRLDRATGQFTRYRLASQEVPPGRITRFHVFLEDQAGQLWVGFGESQDLRLLNRLKLYTFDPASETSVWHEELDAPTMIFIEDTAGILWLSGYGFRGLYKIDPWSGIFRSYTQPFDVGVEDVYEAPDGSLWVLTRGQFVQLDLESGATRNPWQSGVGGNAVAADSSGMLWIAAGGRDALHRLDPRTGAVRTYRHDPEDPSSLSAGYVFEVYIDAAGVLWVGTWAGLNRYHPESDGFTRYESDLDDPKALPAPSVTSVFEDHGGTLWVASTDMEQSYLARLERQTGRFTASPPLPRFISPDPALSRDGTFWLPSDEGLHRYDPATETVEAVFTQAEGLPDNGVVGILEDDDGLLWILTRNGLCRYDPATGAYRTFDTRDGLPSTRFFQAARRLHTGELVFGVSTGFILFDPSAVRENSQPPAVVLTGLRLFNELVRPSPEGPLQAPIEEAVTIRLKHDQNDVTIAYVGLRVRRPERTRYRYRLEGFEPAWREAGARREAVYPNLPPGEYLFRVTATSADGVESERAASLRVIVLPPWWRTGWAYAVYVLLFAAGVVAVDRVQRRRLIRRERQRAEQQAARLRAEAAEAQARALEAETQRTASQAEAAQARAHALEADNRRQELELDRIRHIEEIDRLKSHFFANISHEFRTPLTLILGPVQDALAGRFGPLDNALRRQFDHIHRQGHKLLKLISDLLDLAKHDAGGLHLHRLDVAAWLRSVVLAFTPQAEHDQITLQVHVEPERILAALDPEKLERVVGNLLLNAFKFTPEHGKIRVGLTAEGEGAERLIAITVKDTGQGIAAEDLPHIFDRFRQAEVASGRSQGGTGLGLAVAKELVELHGGTIEVASELGFGTTFTVRLPVAPPAGVPAEWVEEGDGVLSGPEVAGPGLQVEAFEAVAGPENGDGVEGVDGPVVLVVDDNPDMRRYLRGHLAARYAVVEAADGAEALERAQALHPALVIADVMMPELDGIALCRALKADEELNDIPVILLTARAGEASRLEGLGTGAEAYLTKPFRAEELQVRVAQLIAGRRALRRRFSEEVLIGPSEVVATAEEAAFVERVRAVIEAQMEDPGFGVSRLAEEVGLGARQLRRKLRKLVGQNPGDYIRQLRLERAGQLLKQHAGNVAEVAYAVGFKAPH